MSRLAFIVLLTVLSHIGFVGSRITVSLSAINQGASPLTVGVLMALYAVFPMLLAVQGGRLVDRVGAFRPIAIAGAIVAAGVLLPFASRELPVLFATAAVVGTAFMMQHIALNHVIGSIGAPAERAVNFSWFALGYSVSGFIGPLLAGFAIDLAGHRTAFLLLSLPPAIGTALLLWQRPPLPQRHEARDDAAQRHIADLLRNPRLLPIFLFSGLLATGWDMYTFVIPIYGTRIGLSASTIGIVMSSFALATFAVRLFMPSVARRLSEWTVVCTALAIAGTAYSLFPLVTQVPFLIALSFLLGLGLGCAQPMIMAALYAASPPGRQGEVVGMRTTMINASQTFMPLAFGAVGTALGMAPILWTMAALLLTGSWLANRRR
ncbi:MAG TPA: MFS transporter [Burkholderiales bacterium]|jgi:predicted MFS family arabinose efflux permease